MNHINSPLTSVLIPDFFEPIEISTENGMLVPDVDFTLDSDATGRLSIIRLKKIPYIDISRYDHRRRRWYNLDQHGSLWRRYIGGEWIIEENRVCVEWIGGIPSAIDTTRYKYFSVYGLNNGDGIWDNEVADSEYEFSEYNPVVLKVNDASLTDISVYAGYEAGIPELDFINPNNNKEFYYGFVGCL